MNMHILATSCTKSIIEVWDMYSPIKPMSKLESNGNRAISLKIQYPIGYLFSLTDNLVGPNFDDSINYGYKCEYTLKELGGVGFKR